MGPNDADTDDDDGEVAPMDVEPSGSSAITNQATTAFTIMPATAATVGAPLPAASGTNSPQGDATNVAPKSASTGGPAPSVQQRPPGVVVPPKKSGFNLKSRGLPMAKKTIPSATAPAVSIAPKSSSSSSSGSSKDPATKQIAPKLSSLPVPKSISETTTATIATVSTMGSLGKRSFARARVLPVVQKHKIEEKEPSSGSTSMEVDDDDDDEDTNDKKPLASLSDGPPVAELAAAAIPIPSNPSSFATASAAVAAAPTMKSREIHLKDPPEDVPMPPMSMNVPHLQPVAEPPHEAFNPLQQQPQHHLGPNGPPPPPHHHVAPPPLPPHNNTMPIISTMHGPMQPGQYPPGRMPNNRPVKELKVEDALLYLDDVKREFAMQPAIYNEFLVIMKNFKSQTVDTPGVIARVSKLFRGYNNLILGFNTFLPEGHKISMDDLKRMERERVQQEAEEEEKKSAAAAAAARAAAAAEQQAASTSHRGGGRGHSKGSPDRHPEGGGGRPPQQHATVEFDHAISYVTTIKRRFSNDASTYHQFLEILHNYQKEQRGIKEVLEQVAHLFQDHPDLLKEFTFFLPDSVQEQARERMHRAAAESESRIAQRQKQAQQQQQVQLEQSRSSAQLQQVGGSSSTSLDASRKNDSVPAGTAAAAGSSSGSKRNFEMSHAASQDQYVYNSAVERQFFDETRETLSSLTRDGGQNWGEFMKCLDMYAQEVLTRGDMLKHVEPILGKRNSNLFEEFKRILSVAGSASISNQVLEDSWYSVPLAEIDFSRCRKCSPSYRALPRDYPAHPCSGRTTIDLSVLNDIWVSLPVGSEESYTFRHMRRNTYEEQLFRVEDERFEIDMIIDSNRITMQRLMPVAEEIALLGKEDIFPMDLGIKPAEGTGLGGRRFAYSFDKKMLGVVHRNAITRIYGDAGQEMLDLLVKNPTVTIPLVVERLAQKDKEFRLVRERLGRQWKEIAEQNYHKSLDHRSLTWRTTDKRAISTRTLVAEIKDRAMNCGKESKEAYRSKLDKAKEERGGFYETTVGSQLSCNIDTTFFPKPDRRIFTPHLTLVYENVSWAQRDAYRIMAFALERGPIPPADKERCHRLWVEFLGPWFDLSLNWMQKPAVMYQESSKVPSRVSDTTAVVSEDDEESMEDAEMADPANPSPDKDEMMADSDKESLDHHPLPAGAHVSTLYGEGKIISFRRSDKIYAVRLAFGAIGYLRPATVLCSILPVEKSAYTRQLRAEDRTRLARANDQLAFGTQNLYLFFRLHQTLVSRLNVAKKLAFSVGDDSTMQTMVEQMPSLNPTAAGRRRYEAYLSLVYALLDGSIESGKYEDRVRSLLGHHGYALATMDKLIAHIWKDVQAMANDETMWNLVQLYRRHLLAGSFQPDAFRQEAAYLSDGEVMYAFQHCPVVGRDESVLYFEYVGVVEDEDVDPNLMLNQPPYEPNHQLEHAHELGGGGTEEPVTKRSKKG